MAKKKAFKLYFDKAAATSLAEQVSAVWPDFDRGRFLRLAVNGLDELELGERVRKMSSALEKTLPSAVPTALEVLTRSLPEPLPDTHGIIDGFVLWPIGQYIADNGIEHFEPAMAAMVELTKRFTSEFAVRPFVEKRPEPTFKRLLELCDDPNPHVRRWCSEGVRPRLPWGKRLRRLTDDPRPILPILEALKDDPEPYVRRSVANNLNDIAKDHPELVIRVCKRWNKGASGERRRLIKHALRTLVKQGNPSALSVIGFGKPTQIKARLCIMPRRISVGQKIKLSAQLVNHSTQPKDLLVDYVVHFLRADGSSNAKVFKWTTCSLAPCATAKVVRMHAVKRTTVRTLYAGKHRVSLQVNGERVAESFFHLCK